MELRLRFVKGFTLSLGLRGFSGILLPGLAGVGAFVDTGLRMMTQGQCEQHLDRADRSAGRWLLVAFAFLALLLGGTDTARASGGSMPVVQDARLIEEGGYTRFILEMNAHARPDMFTLADDYRLVIDLPEVQWQVRDGTAFAGEGLVTRLRYARNRPGHSRVVLDLDGPATIRAKRMLGPEITNAGYRFILDLETTSQDAFRRTAGWPARHLLQAGFTTANAPLDPEPGSAPTPDAAAPALRTGATRARAEHAAKRVIVIDAGHGGKDPGAIAITGTYEKDVALDMALELRDLLEATGRYTVHMTRDDDTFVPLPERVSFARDNSADLFLSIHADSNPVASVRGASVYTLSETASDKAAARLARKENAINGLESQEVTDDVLKILIELAQRDTMNNSVRFAQTLLPLFGSEGVPLLRNTHRFGPFWVLTAADVPSVLIELGFLSNQTEAELLVTADYRAKLGAGIRHAVDSYFGFETIAGLPGDDNRRVR